MQRQNRSRGKAEPQAVFWNREIRYTGPVRKWIKCSNTNGSIEDVSKPISFCSNMAQRKSKGCQKIELRRIEDEKDCLITFSKCRVGIYKKATKISALCGVEVDVLVFSPSGKPVAHRVTSIEAVADEFLGTEKPPSPNDITAKLFEAHRKAKIGEYNNTYNELAACVELLSVGKNDDRLVNGQQPNRTIVKRE
ncbi:hypothetical protein Nepgr_022210 [Nepenthes gracilis]|uniref:MADS-box domain-containing protein n=1 Tax=Nepenthes gracilis TaxID=150966 RepID=A0AAD3XXU5_NEPGR|nr:hypothetical protein Nepgr_022210 [Nepenthes gracilis]